MSESTDLPVTQRRVSAAGTPPPATSAARSVFHQVTLPPAPKLPEIVIRKDVPLPAPRISNRHSQLRAAALQMQVGDSIELPLKHAHSLMRMARRAGDACTPPRHFIFRRLSDARGAVWRDR
ncbi:MAG TPA: hypothetical protein PKE15_00085 [Ottowia sp.]|nr:hypothetical protein [Ottowia sp.]